MNDICRDASEAADWIAKALHRSGYRADFSPESLLEIDRFFLEHSRNGSPLAGGLLSDDLGARIFAIGAYIGEVIRRAKGGEWRGDNSDPRAEINVEVRLSNGTRFWPVQRAMKRLRNGEVDGIAVYGKALGIEG